MKKLIDAKIVESVRLNGNYGLLKVTPADGQPLPECLPGQFVEIKIDGAGILLRRPISINNVEPEKNLLWLLVRNAGRGTEHLISLPAGSVVNILLPLGNGFTMPEKPGSTVMLVGGGVGVAPLLYLGKKLSEAGHHPLFVLGVRSAADILEKEEFEKVGDVYHSTEDGSYGEKGFVTQHSAMGRSVDRMYVCGPAPMMKAVARIARERDIPTEVSLENMMACGLGACLCCVEKTVRGNVCVCTEGPVFPLTALTW